MTKVWSVVSWNVCHAGSGYGGEDLNGSLAAIPSKSRETISNLYNRSKDYKYHQPEVIFLCEILNVDGRVLKGWTPPGYKLVDIVYGYDKSTALRYCLYVAEKHFPIPVRVLKTGFTRPAVAIEIDGRWIMFIHAPSKKFIKSEGVSSNHGAYQAHVINEAQKNWSNWPYDKIAAVVGDLNVNFDDNLQMVTFGSYLKSPFAEFRAAAPRMATHVKGSQLDWAIYDPESFFWPNVTAFNPQSTMEIEGDEWSPAGESGPKNSDHSAIVFSWTNVSS
ncbi:hypothetical protein G6L28_22600 [Agrobacterium larrymoorei]|uniref:hypothetical protein n=1 Tax=Agrobacterium larrymoorei TaxID=160699 RepID=UPI0015737FED|nr:hypothetical protein [Agrobacterium larrymoorei]NTJ45359.1 hypothetical protein [Agrobacterium larrymoorei]